MEEIVFNKNEIESCGIEITSVSSFIDEVNKLKDDLSGSNEELFFRGQKTDFWDIKPSIFRDYSLSVEHTLMQVPLLKVPHEFKSINNDFEIMTKYQHYGMCTRLLDLTTNPLVALFFACEPYGEVYYKGLLDDLSKEDDKEQDSKVQEANGVAFFNKSYPTHTNGVEIKVISALSKMDLSKDNTVESVLGKLEENNVISKSLGEKWRSEDYYKEFIDIVQNNYVVIPPYTNERLTRQCGLFLLVSCFNFSYTESIKTSTIEKGYKDLRDEFDRRYFYILGENKARILDELDTYNINEATLFPELEHHLSYIKNKKNALKIPSSEFVKFDYHDILENSKISGGNIIENILDNEEFKLEVIKALNEKYSFDIDGLWKVIELWTSIVDWNCQGSIISKFKIRIQRVLIDNGLNKEQAKKDADYICNNVIETGIKLLKGSD